MGLSPIPRDPGPLWDKTWTATKLGLEEDVLDDYLGELYSTSYGEFTYDGIFHIGLESAGGLPS